MDNSLLNEKFDEISGKVDSLIELCRNLQSENRELKQKISELEVELGNKDRVEDQYYEQHAAIQSKIDGLLAKLRHFSENQAKSSQSTG